MPYGTTRSMTIDTIEVSLTGIVANGGEWAITVPAREGRCHAVLGRLVGDTDATASGLAIDLDGWGDADFFRRRLLRARRRVFDRAADVGRLLWKRTSPLAKAGLLAHGPATIASPVSQMCTVAQIEEPAFADWLATLEMGNQRHRKQWEMVYILATLTERGAIRPGARGLGFGCGAECMPSYFAARGCSIVATDLPVSHQDAAGWVDSGQHVAAADALRWTNLCDEAVFRERVSFRDVDMTRIPPDLVDFDFCWSACAYEHLGSIEAGLKFIHDAVRCLRPGGVAVHTTELNLSSNGTTIDNESTVLFRRRDMERLALELTAAGHRVLPINYDTGDRPMDLHIDVPPYVEKNHLKVALGRYVTTSFGIAVIKGPASR
jgi:SAM-dependent methyltransferase